MKVTYESMNAKGALLFVPVSYLTVFETVHSHAFKGGIMHMEQIVGFQFMFGAGSPRFPLVAAK